MTENIIKVNAKSPFGVIVCQGAKEYLVPLLSNSKKVVIVCDEDISKMFVKKLTKVIERNDLEVLSFTFPTKENGKSKFMFDKLLVLLTDMNFDKNDCMIALGGKTAMSITGFVASVYKGGINYVNIPTSLYSMCGDCISGNVGVDLLGRTNLLSTTYYPQAVLCDMEFLNSLSQEQLSSGLAEIVRCGLAIDKAFFEKMEQIDFNIEEGVYYILKDKAQIEIHSLVAYGKDKKLELGNLFAKAIELVSHYTIDRKSALAYSLVMATGFADKTGLTTGLKDRVITILNKLGIIWEINIDPNKVIDFIVSDVKVIDNGIDALIPIKPGKCTTVHYTANEFKEVWFGR